MRKRSYKGIKVVLRKKRLLKTANIRQMRAFSKWPKMATIQRLDPLQDAQFWSKKQCLKHAKNVSKNTLKLFYGTNGS